MNPKKSEDERVYWSETWRLARGNMPRRHPYNMGSPTVLRALLGYKVGPSESGVPTGVGQHCRTAEDRGDRPRCPQRQRILKMLAGPHGKTIAIAIAIQRGFDLSKWKHWP